MKYYGTINRIMHIYVKHNVI